MKPKSWVWQYAHRKGDLGFCDLCKKGKKNSFSCRGGTTGSLGRHLQKIHGILNTEENLTHTDNSMNGDGDMQNTDVKEGNLRSSNRMEEIGVIKIEENSIYSMSDDDDGDMENIEIKEEDSFLLISEVASTPEIGRIMQCSSDALEEIEQTESLGRNSRRTGNIKTGENSIYTDKSIIGDGEMQNSEANEENCFTVISEPCSSKKQRTHKRKVQRVENPNVCSSSREEEIHQALAKMISLNQMPISFCLSEGFRQFMAIVEPNYRLLKEDAIKRRLQTMKRNIEKIIKNKISKAVGVSCTSECWTSAAEASYITMTAHFIDENWVTRSFALETDEIDTGHDTENLVNGLEDMFQKWELSEKIVAVVTDNAPNVVKAVESLKQVQERFNLTCAAHSLKLTLNKSIAPEYIQKLIEKATKVVDYFKCSSAAKCALAEKQKQLSLQVLPLLQSCKTKWIPFFLMLQRLIQNRDPVMNVLADRTVTPSTMAAKLEISEQEWTRIKELANILQPIQMVINVLSCEDSPTSMVRPLIQKLLQIHMVLSDNDSDMLKQFKIIFSNDLRRRYDTSDTISARQIASLLDPRYKNLEHERYDVRVAIKEKVKQLLTENAPIEDTTKTNNIDMTDITLEKKIALEFLYERTSDDQTDIENQLERYLSEPQLKFDMNPFEWWRYREDSYPAIALLARRYLCIPATSLSSEYCFSSAGNIATFNRDSLLPENVDLSVFLYQNRNCSLN